MCRFFVNIHTKESTWTKPTQPAYPPGASEGPGGAPPGYSGNSHTPMTDSKTNPFASPGGVEDDEALARRLQAEEDERVKTRGNAMQDYQNTALPAQYGQSSSSLPQQYGTPSPQPAYGQTTTGERGDKKKGLFSKLLGAAAGSKMSSHGQQQHYGGQPQYGQQNYGGKEFLNKSFITRTPQIWT